MIVQLAVFALAGYVTGPLPCRNVGPAVPTMSSAQVVMGYVPDGLTPEQWAKIRKEEQEKAKGLGRVGTNRFQSRSMYAFQKALEAGEATHLFPVDPKKVKRGEIKEADVPYMQRRGGRWDQSDVKGAKRRRWNRYDKAYENGGRDADSSVSIFGGASLPWRTQDLAGMSKGPDAELIKQWKRMGVKVDKNGNPLSRASAKRPTAAAAAEEPKKKFFGLF